MEIVSVQKYKSFVNPTVTTQSIDEMNSLLLKDQGYHFKWKNDGVTEYTLQFDIDGKQSENFTINEFCMCLSSFFSIELKQIFYTKNYSKEVSYHVSIPLIKGTLKQQLFVAKEINTNSVFKVDEAIYKNVLYRAPNQSKEMIKGTEHIVVYGLIKHFNVFDLTQSSMALHHEEQAQEQTQEHHETDKIKITVEQAKELVDLIPSTMADTYNDWITILFCLKCENNDDYFPVFDYFSQKSESYNYKSCIDKWKQYTPKHNKTYTYNSLFKFARKNNIDAYNVFVEKHKFFKEINKTQINTLEIEKEYLLEDQKLSNCDVSQQVFDFMNTSVKGLIIKSAYDTGKTTLLKEISPAYERILFITYRITLTDNLMGGFRDLGFKTYTEKLDAPRIICQVDSLRKLPLAEFDLIIMDESESLLNHLSSTTITKKYGTYKLLKWICESSKKVIALDGDVSERTRIFIKEVTNNKVIMIKNTIRKNPKKFIFHRDEEKFELMIKEDLEVDKNICIVSMSSAIAERYYQQNKDKYRSILYTANTSDSQKRLLCDVTSIWSNHQLVIYSPSIESGVDYNIEHFDKIYIVMASGSTSQRGLFQMMNRIRKLRISEVNVYLNNIPANETSIKRHYQFNEVKGFFSNDEDSADETYEKIMMYNKLEELNKNSNCFLPLFIQMALKKGHTYAFAEEKMTRVKVVIPFIEKIADAENITKKQSEQLKKLQSMRQLEEDDKYKLTKYIYTNTFNTSFDDVEIVKKFFKRLSMIKNCRRIMGENKKTYDEVVNSVLFEIFRVDANYLLKRNVTISREELLDSIKSVNQIIRFNKILLGLPKTVEIKTSNKLLSIVKELFMNYGIEIVVPKSKKESTYTLKMIDEVANLELKLKNEVDDVIDDFIDDDDMTYSFNKLNNAKALDGTLV